MPRDFSRRTHVVRSYNCNMIQQRDASALGDQCRWKMGMTYLRCDCPHNVVVWCWPWSLTYGAASRPLRMRWLHPQAASVEHVDRSALVGFQFTLTKVLPPPGVRIRWEQRELERSADLEIRGRGWFPVGSMGGMREHGTMSRVSRCSHPHGCGALGAARRASMEDFEAIYSSWE